MALFSLLTGTQLFDVLDGTLTLPRFGTWTARLVLGEDAAPGGPASGTLFVAAETGEPTAFVGTIVDPPRHHEGRVFVELVGAAGLLGDVAPVHYAAAPTPVAMADVVADLVAAADEQLADGALAALAGLTVPRWSRLAGESWAAALGRAVERFGLGWRTLADGAVWVGPETWPAVAAEPFLEWDDTETGVLHVTFDDARWRPGMIILDKRISRVSYQASGRAELAYETDEGELFARLVGRFSRTSPYAVTYDAEVVEQREDGTLDLLLVDGPIPDLRHVPFETGVEGGRMVIPAKARVRVAFRGGLPDGAVACGRPNDMTATRGIARFGDHATGGTLTFAGAGPLTISYVPPGGAGQTVGVITATSAGSPVVFAGTVTIPLEDIIDSASEEAFLR